MSFSITDKYTRIDMSVKDGESVLCWATGDTSHQHRYPQREC